MPPRRSADRFSGKIIVRRTLGPIVVAESLGTTMRNSYERISLRVPRWKPSRPFAGADAAGNAEMDDLDAGTGREGAPERPGPPARCRGQTGEWPQQKRNRWAVRREGPGGRLQSHRGPRSGAGGGA